MWIIFELTAILLIVKSILKLFDLKIEYKKLTEIIREMDRKVIIIFISVAILQTISYYFASRRFFRINFFPIIQNNPNVYLYEYLFWFITDFITLFLIASLIVKLVLKEPLKNYGLQIGDFKAGLSIALTFFILMVPAIWLFSATPDFTVKYPHLLSSRSNWTEFFIYESGMMLYMIGWEFIWRGFMLFGLKERFGYYSVLIQMIPFVILHNGKPAPETFGAIAGGIALGALAFRTNSIYYCIIAHMGVMFTIDLTSSLRYRANDYGVGIDSLFNIIKIIF